MITIDWRFQCAGIIPCNDVHLVSDLSPSKETFPSPQPIY